ncbi:MAG: hypothetical protein ACE5I5_05325 [Candidatus Heimdallarchaeota archaeon]
MESAFSVTASGGGYLWTVDECISLDKMTDAGVSEREILCIDVFVRDASAHGGMCGIKSRASHIANLGGVPMTMYF